jgi:hypothetical protein
MRTNVSKIDGALVGLGLALLISFSTRAFAVEAGVAPVSGMPITEPETAKPQSIPSAPSKSPAGLLPIPDYSANLWRREQLTGDWWGGRTYLATDGIQIGVELNQYVQGVTNGGRDQTAAYGGTADYTVNLDLMRMGILPGALIKFRAESRFGNSVNGDAGPILPVNTDLLFRSLISSMRISPSRSPTSIIPNSFRPISAFSLASSTRSTVIRTSSLPGAEPASS